MAVVVTRVPKTRSGKILRGTVKKMVDGAEYGVPATSTIPRSSTRPPPPSAASVVRGDSAFAQSMLMARAMTLEPQG